MTENFLTKLIEISQYYGTNPQYIIAGGGNTSYKNNEYIWVKASGTSLSNIDENGFVCLSRSILKQIKDKTYSNNSAEREEQVKFDLNQAIVAPKHLRPSVETSMHDIIDYSYIVHTHPTYANALLCSKNAESLTYEIFGDDVVYIEYTDPGYVLFKKVLERISKFKATKGYMPSVIFLQNHGVFVGANTLEEIKAIYANIEEKLSSRIINNTFDASVQHTSCDKLAILQKYFAEKSLISQGYIGELINRFIEDREAFALISKPFTPDIIVYCKSNYLFIEKGANERDIIKAINQFGNAHGYLPKVILIENECLAIVEDSASNIQKVLDVFLDMMKISLFSENFGGQNFMTSEQISFIDNWEVENYRRKVSKGL